jgi:hypothetical protein
MAILDYMMTENQKKYVRLAYELAISIMLVIALQYASFAYDEGSADCKIFFLKQGHFYGFDDINITTPSLYNYMNNISIREIGTNETIPILLYPPTS